LARIYIASCGLSIFLGFSGRYSAYQNFGVGLCIGSRADSWTFPHTTGCSAYK
jgi:hypothetical protein